MNPSNAPDGTSEDSLPRNVQDELMFFLRPTVSDDDDTWEPVASLTEEQKKFLIQEATSSELPSSASGSGVAGTHGDGDAADTTIDRGPANAFGTAMLAEFDSYDRDYLSEEEYAAVLNFLAFAKWSDLYTFERIDRGDFYDDGDLQAKCALMLEKARCRGYIAEVPEVDVLEGGHIEIQLFPYLPRIAIFINGAEPLVPEEQILANLEFTVFHEVGHYLFWYAKIGDLTIEAWARAMLVDLEVDVQGEAYRKFEELFCDRVGVAFGGTNAADALMRAIIRCLEPGHSDFWRVRLISLLRGTKALHSRGFRNLLIRTNSILYEKDNSIAPIDESEIENPTEPYVTALDDPAMQSFMLGFVGSCTQGQATAARESLTPAELIGKFKEQWNEQAALKKFPLEWFVVIQALGWGNRPTKNNIGT